MKALLPSLAVAAVMTGFIGTAEAQTTGGASATGSSVVLPIQSPTALAFPTIFGASSAVPAPGGTGYVALTLVDPRGGVAGRDSDGDLAFGYTFGSPVTGISTTVAVNVLGLDPLGDSGDFAISFSRMLQAGENSATFVALAAGDLFGWGPAQTNDPIYTLTLSHLTSFATAGGVEIPVQVSVGYGNLSTLSDDGLGVVGPGAYLGLGIGVTENLAASISATENQINMGLSLTVPQVPGLGLTLGVYDVTDNTSRQQVTLGAAFAF